MSLLPPNRVLTTHKELRKLPVGAVVANGYGKDYYLFQKAETDEGGGYWKWYDPSSKHPYHKQNALHSLHPTYVSEKGFRILNLPVYLLTKTGDPEELRVQLDHFLHDL